MSIWKWIRRVFLAFVSLGCILAWAQDVSVSKKHPRVSELEDFLQREANDFLKGRFPGQPVLVKVKIDPLHRSSRYDDRAQESLPYMDLDQEEIKDEWDDPSATTWALLNRVRRIQVNVSLSESITDDEIGETKENLSATLKLVGGRDEVNVERKKWVRPDRTFLLAGFFLLLAVIAIIAGLYFVNQASIKKVAAAILELKPEVEKDAGGTNGASGGSLNVGSTDVLSQESQKRSEMSVSDPLRIQEFVTNAARLLEKRSGFPSRFDVYELDELGRNHPEELGAVVVNFTPETQRRLFSMTGKGHWVTAFAQPGSASISALEVVQKLARMSRDPGVAAWDQLIIQVWRMNSDQRQDFLKRLDKKEVFQILRELPKGDAVNAARTLFPGAWAPVLEHPEGEKIVAASRCEELLKSSHDVLPLAKFDRVENFLEEKTLLEYIRFASVNEERELYAVLKEDSLVKERRVAFYPVLDAPDAVKKELCLAFSPEQWAVALMGVEFTERARVEQHFNEKQKYLYSEMRRRYEQARPSRDRIADMREKIAKIYSEMSKNVEEFPRRRATDAPASAKKAA
jgi:hypothetical protein